MNFFTEHASAFFLPVARIVRMGSEEKMLRVYASWHIAFVAYQHARRNLAAKEHPSRPMRDVRFTLQPQDTIPGLIQLSPP